METHGLSLVVRNTFLHYSKEEKSSEELVRSSSAPPSCRTPKGGKAGDRESAAASTFCESLAPDTYTDLVTDSEDAASYTSGIADHEGDAAAAFAVEPCTDNDEVSPQDKLDLMSQQVLDIWAQLRAVETSLEAAETSPTTETLPAAAQSQISWADLSTEANDFPGEKDESADQKDESPCQKLVSNARLFVPGRAIAETFHSVLTLVGLALRSAIGVADVDVKVGPVGTLATVSIRLAPGNSPFSVINAAKSALLEVAANSKSTYVLGYEHNPFQDDTGPGRYSFCTSLASMPKGWECCVCWDTYTKGFCPRPRTCKWQHPGRTELQPVRVVVL